MLKIDLWTCYQKPMIYRNNPMEIRAKKYGMFYRVDGNVWQTPSFMLQIVLNILLRVQFIFMLTQLWLIMLAAASYAKRYAKVDGDAEMEIETHKKKHLPWRWHWESLKEYIALKGEATSFCPFFCTLNCSHKGF
jgi:hypothetical protein